MIERGELRHLACSVYFSVLQHLPALARHWWTTQDRRVADLVDKYVTAHIVYIVRFTSNYASPDLCS